MIKSASRLCRRFQLFGLRRSGCRYGLSFNTSFPAGECLGLRGRDNMHSLYNTRPITLTKEAEERFQRNIFPEPNSGCWLWGGYYGHGSYGSFHFQGKQYRAHRISFTIHRGKIPPGKHIDHLCKNRACVNPDHLEVVTLSENTRRALKSRPLKTHCKHGHELTPENVFIRKNARICKACELRNWKVRLKSYRAEEPKATPSAQQVDQPA